MGLACENLRFSYRGSGVELFDGLSHEFLVGGLTAVAGRSGRGKSTLLYILGLMLTPGAGKVLFDGRAVSHLPDGERARIRAKSVGFVFQDAVLDPARKVIDSIVEPALYAGLSKRRAVERAVALAKVTGVGARLDHKPGAISGGEAQRVALARALLLDPAVILADEPTGNLDQENSQMVIGLLRRAAEAGKTVVVATHDPVLAGEVDETVML
jgi:putative ABC transport system ATP-binding protein/lipoprotein-releasing system ATP-binding protein